MHPINGFSCGRTMIDQQSLNLDAAIGGGFYGSDSNASIDPREARPEYKVRKLFLTCK